MVDLGDVSLGLVENLGLHLLNPHLLLLLLVVFGRLVVNVVDLCQPLLSRPLANHYVVVNEVQLVQLRIVLDRNFSVGHLQLGLLLDDDLVADVVFLMHRILGQHVFSELLLYRGDVNLGLGGCLLSLLSLHLFRQQFRAIFVL